METNVKVNIVGTIDDFVIEFPLLDDSYKYVISKKDIRDDIYRAYVYAIKDSQYPRCYDAFNKWRYSNDKPDYFKDNEFLEIVINDNK